MSATTQPSVQLTDAQINQIVSRVQQALSTTQQPQDTFEKVVEFFTGDGQTVVSNIVRQLQQPIQDMLQNAVGNSAAIAGPTIRAWRGLSQVSSYPTQSLGEPLEFFNRNAPEIARQTGPAVLQALAGILPVVIAGIAISQQNQQTSQQQPTLQQTDNGKSSGSYSGPNVNETGNWNSRTN